ncbi:MAG TPA: hypothetical protein VHP57_03025 [Acidimicrobiia bacterium]|nr:hypothetical protein [Acidimicrobiia bacterium]
MGDGAHGQVLALQPLERGEGDVEQRGVERADAEARMAAQATDAQRREVATYVIDNAGDPATLDAQVDEVWADLERRRAAATR